jgi:hypothetical protein
MWLGLYINVVSTDPVIYMAWMPSFSFAAQDVVKSAIHLDVATYTCISNKWRNIAHTSYESFFQQWLRLCKCDRFRPLSFGFVLRVKEQKLFSRCSSKRKNCYNVCVVWRLVWVHTMCTTPLSYFLVIVLVCVDAGGRGRG